MTGVGQMVPAMEDGSTGPLLPPYPVTLNYLSATVNRVSTPVVYAYQAPGRVAGIVQVGVLVPPSTAPGDATVAVAVGSASPRVSQTATIVVR
jgi:uncharacterized protein (TIGR03437 family)